MKKQEELFECPDCEGFGWNEGGKFLQTTCKTCKGTGIINKHLKEVMYEGKCREKH
jgi:DnaJ-class molecular chaperone